MGRASSSVRRERASAASRGCSLFLRTEAPLPRGYDGAYSSDGSRLAYMPNDPANEIWKRYRGGETSEIWLANMSDASIERIPRENSNDSWPMWVGNSVYFLS